MTGPRPSDTRAGKSWLSNFSAQDQETARMLLDSIELVPLSTVRLELRHRLRELVTEHKIASPAMLVSALSIEDLPALDEGQPPHVAFESFMLDCRISSTPGSEGFVGNLVRDLLPNEPLETCPWLPPSSSIDELRDLKCRSIVIVTDYSGSGTQLNNFALTIVRNATIRSWRSYGLIRICAVSFAANTQAFELLDAFGSPIDDFWSVRAAPTFSDRGWTGDETQAVEDLCHKYAFKQLRSQALGYKESRGLFATDSSVPNNLPAVLHQAGYNWHPFFGDRIVPTSVIEELTHYTPEYGLTDIATTSNQQRLARNFQTMHTRTVSTQMLALLALLTKKTYSVVDLANRSRYSFSEVEGLLASLTELEFIDPQRQLTDFGWREIHASKRARRITTADICGTDELYYPSGMR